MGDYKKSINKKMIQTTVGNFVLDEFKSKLDIRDTVVETLRIIREQEIRDYVDYRSFLGDPRNQGSQGSCSAQTGSAIKEFQEFQDLQGKDYLSPQFLHNHRPFPNLREGSTPRSTMRNLLYHGICKENEYPYGKIERQHKIDSDVKESALKYKIKNYAKVLTVKGLKRALCVNGPCYMSVPVFNHTGQMWLKRKGDLKSGYHAMTVVGYNDEGFILRNSWGQKWNGNGYTIFPYGHWDLHSECWTVFDIVRNDEIPKNRIRSFLWTLRCFPKRLVKRGVWRFRNK